MADFGIMFEHLGEVVEIRFVNNSLIVRSSVYGTQFDYIYNSFQEEMVKKQFPELESCIDWKMKAYNKLIDKINSFQLEFDKIQYLINELKPHGYVAKYVMRKGFRPQMVRHV